MTWNVTLSQEGAGNPTEWDKVWFAGNECPGIARVNASLPNGLDVQKPKGGKRATIKDNGDPPIRLDVTLELLPDELPDLVQTVLPSLRPVGKDGGRAPVSFWHPMATALNVANVIVSDVQLKHPKSGGTMTVTIKCMEWVPAPAKVKAKTTPEDGSGQLALERVAQGSTDPNDLFGGLGEAVEIFRLGISS